MKIDLVNLKRQHDLIKSEIEISIKSVIESCDFINGEEVKIFSDRWSKIHNSRYFVPMGNGTDSLYIALKSLGIGTGDEVITSAVSWISSSEIISLTGAKPVFCDIDPIYYTIDESKIEELINENTKAIIPVHLYGQMCNMDFIMSLAKKYNLKVIEDCAQSHLSKYNNLLAGTIGDFGSFSFYPGKNLGAFGDAGGLLCKSFKNFKFCKAFANHGALKKHEHFMEGTNSRMDSFNAAVLNIKLKTLEADNLNRFNAAKKYNSILSGISQIVTPKIRDNTYHSFHLYVIRIKERDKMIKYLKNQGISCAIHYPTPLPLLKAYSHMNLDHSTFGESISHAKEIISLPLFPSISDEEINYVCKKIKKFLNAI